MYFQNLQVDWENLPRSAAATLQPIQPKYLRVLYIAWTLFYLVAIVGWLLCLVWIPEMRNTKWLILAIVLMMLAITGTFIITTGSFRRKGYAVREKDVLYRTGWIFQKLHIVPYNRVQHCVVQSGPIERRFGLASVSIYTAAAHISDITIHGLAPDEANALKTYIIDQMQPLQG